MLDSWMWSGSVRRDSESLRWWSFWPRWGQAKAESQWGPGITLRHPGDPFEEEEARYGLSSLVT